MNFKSHRAPERQGFPLAPMVDIMFLLLCFFVATQIYAQWETEITIALPVSATGDQPGRLPTEIIINITQDGTRVVNQRQLDDAALRDLLGRIAAIYPDQSVIVRADRQTAYEHLIAVLDACRETGIGNISFATGMPEE